MGRRSAKDIQTNKKEKPAELFESEEPTELLESSKPEIAEEEEVQQPTELIESEEPTELIESEEPTELIGLEESTELLKSEQATELLDKEALERERQFAAQRVEDEAEAVDSLYSDEDSENEYLTALLQPIGPNARTVTPVSQGPTDTVWHTIEQGERRVRHKVAAAIISIIVVFGIGLGAGLYKKHLESEADTAARIAENERLAEEARIAQEQADAEAEEQRKLEEARAPRDLKFIVSAADYDLLATRIPLSITGTDLEGNEVKTTAFINAEGDGVSLAPGEYNATIPASPVRPNGQMYRVPSDTYSLRIPNDERSEIQIDQAIVLIPLNIAELTEDMINNAYTWGIKDERNASVVETNVAAARKVLEEEVARAREEERRRQAQELRAPLAQQFAESFFTNVSFPDESDDSKVLVVTNWNAVVGQYTAPGSSANAKVNNGNGARYSFATHVSASSISGDTVSVDVEFVSGNEIKNGWTRNASKKSISCTFNDDNKIVDFSIS